MLSRIHAPRRHTPSCPFFRTDGELHEPAAAARTPKAASRSPFSARSDCKCSVEPMVTSFIVKIKSPAFMPPFFAGGDGALVLRKSHDQHTLGKELHANRLADRHEQRPLRPGPAPHGSRRHEQGGGVQKTNAAQAAAPCRLLRFRRLSSIPSPLLFKRNRFLLKFFAAFLLAALLLFAKAQKIARTKSVGIGMEMTCFRGRDKKRKPQVKTCGFRKNSEKSTLTIENLENVGKGIVFLLSLLLRLGSRLVLFIIDGLDAGLRLRRLLFPRRARQPRRSYRRQSRWQ